jgi:hypothetical protein
LFVSSLTAFFDNLLGKSVCLSSFWTLAFI